MKKRIVLTMCIVLPIGLATAYAQQYDTQPDDLASRLPLALAGQWTDDGHRVKVTLDGSNVKAV